MAMKPASTSSEHDGVVRAEVEYPAVVVPVLHLPLAQAGRAAAQAGGLVGTVAPQVVGQAQAGVGEHVELAGLIGQPRVQPRIVGLAAHQT